MNMNNPWLNFSIMNMKDLFFKSYLYYKLQKIIHS